ncbi:MAG TPA: hypothetical protein VKS01_05160 [Bryobacteraceae bacterium]|nr:hypothetical protein [Bryobacteraceae bacterium]
MKKLLMVLAVSGIAFAGEWTGYISDAKCATASAKAKTAAEWIKPAVFESCVKTCVKAGSPAVFVTLDNQMLKFDAASMDKVTPMLGHKVTVSGKVDNGVMSVETISDAK